jgi:hypothetical protein
MIVSDLVYTALRLCGVLSAPGRGPSPSDLADGLSALNSLLDQWTSERLMIYAITPSTVDVVATQGTYQLGPGASDWDLALPPLIERASVMPAHVAPALPQEIPLRIVTPAEWQTIEVKEVPATFPTHLYYDRIFPIASVRLWPIPQVDCSIVLYLWELLDRFVALTDIVAFPPGYQRALEYQLALELAPRYPGRAVISEVVAAEAMKSKAQIAEINVQATGLATAPAVVAA